MATCQEAFNRRLPVCCFLSLLSPLFLISPCPARGAGKPLPGWRSKRWDACIGCHSLAFPFGERDCLQLSLFIMDHIMFCKSGILIFIFTENNYLVIKTRQIKTPLLYQSLGSHAFLSFFSSLFISLFLADSLNVKAGCITQGILASFFLSLSHHQLWTTRFWSIKGQTATHSSILAQRIPLTEEPGGLQSKGSPRVGHH